MEREAGGRDVWRDENICFANDSWEAFARESPWLGLEGVQEIEELQLIIFVPAGDQQAREIVLAQAHLRRFRYFRQAVRNRGWHATRRGLV